MSFHLNVPQHYKSIKLGELFLYVIGGDWGKELSHNSEEYVEALCIRGSEFRNWDHDKGRTAVFRKIKRSSIQNRQLREGDILIEVSGGGPEQPVGRTVLVDNEVLSYKPELAKLCTNFLRLARPINNISSKYLHFYLIYFYKTGEIVKYQGGSNNLRNLKFEEFISIDIPLPPLPEQHRIVAKIEELFSELDKAIESLKTAQQQLKVYRQAVLKYAFEGKLTNPELKEGELPEGWVVNKLGKIFDTTSGGTPSRKIDSYFNGDIPWIKSGELRNSTIYSAEEYISEDALQNSSAKIFPVGTLLIALYGATIGKLSFLGIEAATNQAICGIFPSDELEIRYLFYYLNYRKRELIRLAVGGAQPNISQNILRDLSVVYPESIDAQNDVISEIESATSLCEKLEEGIDKNLVQMQAFKQSILKSAFEGKLVPQDPNDEPASVLLERIKFERSNTEPVKKTRAKKATA